jgi:hypothetical protein
MAAAAVDAPAADARRRVKVWLAAGTGWLDHGIGSCSLELEGPHHVCGYARGAGWGALVDVRDSRACRSSLTWSCMTMKTSASSRFRSPQRPTTSASKVRARGRPTARAVAQAAARVSPDPQRK